VAGQIKKIVVSDFHLADGVREGELNPWESFYHDAKFAELIRYHSTDYFEDEPFELIIGGDFFDLLQVRYDGEFPVEITERIAVAKLKACLDGHPEVIQAMRDFVNTPHKQITVLPGNHDFELVFPACQRLWTEYVCGAPEDPRMRFVIEEPHYEFDGIQVHHGMQFEAMNRYDWNRKFITEGRDEPILRQPFGSIFIIEVLNVLKEKRPYVDRVQPFKMYLLGALLFDTLVAFRLIWLALLTFYRFRVRPMLRDPKSALSKEAWQAFFEYNAFPNLEHKVRKLVRNNPRVHTVIMGHTHLAKVRRFGRNKTYVNTGTWTDLISLDISTLGMNRELTYAAIEYFEDPDTHPQAKLRRWHGYRELWQDIPY
jgi:UDP-2,3-diacylglucosamine pyrophosphatase LpxH